MMSELKPDESRLLTRDSDNFYELIQSCKGKLIDDLHEADFYPSPITSSFLWMEGVIEHIAEVFVKAQDAKTASIKDAECDERVRELTIAINEAAFELKDAECQARVERIFKEADTMCIHYGNEGTKWVKRCCDECWQALKEGVKW